MIDIDAMIKKEIENGYGDTNAQAKVCQDLILKAIAKSSLNRNVTIKGGVVMRSKTKNVRRATQDLDLDFIRYSLSDESIDAFIAKLNCLEGLTFKRKGEIKELKFDHRRRCLIYAPKKKNYWPILLNEIKTSLSNNHCIPANEQIRKKLLKIRKYDLVTIKGKLVSVEKEGMAPWTSSLSRDDGPGWGKLVGCEIIYVTEIDFLKKDNKNF